MVLKKVLLFHDLPTVNGIHKLSKLYGKLTTVKFKRGDQEALLASLIYGERPLVHHADLQLQLRKLGEKSLGKGWTLEKHSDSYGDVLVDAGGGTVEIYYSRLKRDKLNALMQAFLKVIPNFPKNATVIIPPVEKIRKKITEVKNYYAAVERISVEKILKKKVKVGIKTDYFWKPLSP
ncbi:hypothetical protein H0N96_02465 [Candidatus Micrarchaeota archaeon]|nr:hypothetical protein [Candidatus Micrarchaeota archaeon]